MAGYWRAPELSRSRFRATKAGVTLRTGDHGHLDDAGRFHFQGRRDDLFKLRGLRVSGTEIEAAARDVDGVAAAVVLTPTGANPGTLVVAGSITPSELVEQLTAVIGAAKVPTSCRVVDELPYTTNGKVDRKALRARLAR
jgi:acyl-coenzyme A synthetase/AMP-(fatty) acid ligase